MHIKENELASNYEQNSRRWQFAVASGILGWVLDAFDFFVIIFLFDTLASHLHVQKKAIVWTISITLAMRPVGALIFGALADRFGRKKPLILCVIYFSAITIMSGFAPNYTFFVVMRALYGIGMGGYWGIGASFAMENAPRNRRGILSGVMQGGYPFGYLLAAVGMLTIMPRFGWHAMFIVGSLLATAIVILTSLSSESEAWEQHRMRSVVSIFKTLFQHTRSFFYLLVMMVLMSCLSHGTQDLYPDFLKTLPEINRSLVLGMKPLYGIPIIYNIGAITGAIFFGHISERIGRRHAVMVALALSLLSIPAWAFGGSIIVLIFGSLLMQTGVQGAFGVIPAHLNELSPDPVRSLFPGLVYQLGALLASPAVSVEFLLRSYLGYPTALSAFELVVIVMLLLVFGFGPEQHGRSFRSMENKSSFVKTNF
jgi:SHS family lactate transporter-like MFS transporter